MDLTLEQKVGQLMIIGWPSTKAEDVIELIEKYHFGNIILFTRNIKSASSIKEEIRKIQEAAIKYNGIPAFICIDQEGGNVRRIYDGVTQVPGLMAIGAASSYDEDAAYKIGKIVGEELKYLGININFSPVVDINSNPKNPIIGIRAFSDNPRLVSKLSAKYARGIEENGVIATYKHFMGHGNVMIDSHLDLPQLNTSYEELKECELVPYLTSEYQPQAIMTAHILYNKIDDRFPATLSRKIIHDILRKEMNYQGLVITDCYEMEAVSRAFALEEAGVFSIKATVDLVLVSHTFGRQMKVRNGIIKAVLNGEISERELNERLENVLRHKAIFTKQKLHHEVNIKKNEQIADEVSLNSVTLVSGEPFPIDEKTIIIGVTNYLNTSAEDKNVEKMDIAKIIGKEFNIPHLSIDSKNFNVNEIANFAKNKKVILALSDSHLTLIQRVLYTHLKQNQEKLMLISLRTPYDVLSQELPDCHYAIYEYTRKSVSSLIKVLKGHKPNGVCPVKLDVNGGKIQSEGIENYLVRNAIQYIKENYTKHITLSDVADELNVSNEHLSRLIKKITNRNFSDHLISIRINHAMRYLKTTTLRVYEISLLTGFNDTNYFTKVFKKIVGMTPKEYRNQVEVNI